MSIQRRLVGYQFNEETKYFQARQKYSLPLSAAVELLFLLETFRWMAGVVTSFFMVLIRIIRALSLGLPCPSEGLHPSSVISSNITQGRNHRK